MLHITTQGDSSFLSSRSCTINPLRRFSLLKLGVKVSYLSSRISNFLQYISGSMPHLHIGFSDFKGVDSVMVPHSALLLSKKSIMTSYGSEPLYSMRLIIFPTDFPLIALLSIVNSCLFFSFHLLVFSVSVGSGYFGLMSLG